MGGNWQTSIGYSQAHRIRRDEAAPSACLTPSRSMSGFLPSSPAGERLASADTLLSPSSDPYLKPFHFDDVMGFAKESSKLENIVMMRKGGTSMQRDKQREFIPHVRAARPFMLQK